MKTDIAKYIDHTLLKADAKATDIERLCREAREHGFASVCVNSCWVPMCRELLAGSGVAVCTVIGFPLGAASTQAKVAESLQAIEDGADELDEVLNQGLLKSDAKACFRELCEIVRRCREARKDVVLKLILECCNLTKAEIESASKAAKKAGFDFVKTSTGFGKGGATVADVKLMRKSVGPKMGVKAAGGIRDRKTALAMIRAGATRLGCSCGLALVMRMSAKAVCAAALLAALAGGCSRGEIDRVEWPVMGTIAAVQLKGELTPGSGSFSADVMAAFNDVSDALNAHVATSEICSLATLADDEVLAKCADKMKPCYEAAFTLMRVSGGAFNPRWRGPKTLDLGAIAKGFAVDFAVEGMQNRRSAGLTGGSGVPPLQGTESTPGPDVDILIDLGGNIKAAKGNWRTGVMDPRGGGFAAVVDLREGEALATSATYYRGSHIYDGRTGLAVSNGVASVTVLCRSAMWADGLSTTLFVLGPDEGRTFVEEKGRLLMGGEEVAVLWILSDGRQLRLDHDARFR